MQRPSPSSTPVPGGAFGPAALGVLVGLVLGLAAGFTLGREAIVVRVEVPPMPAPVMMAPATVEAPAPATAPPLPPPVARAPSAPASLAPPPPGRPLRFPGDLPDRFAAAKLQAALQEAIVDMAVVGSVGRVDCAEFPCIAYGRVTEDDDLDSLLDSDVLEPYASDGRALHRFSQEPTADGPATFERHHFALALYPAGLDPGERQALEVRVAARVRGNLGPPP